MNELITIALRPKMFSEVIGQENVVRALENQLSSDAVPRAVMFVGPSGIGKTSLARILAREVQGADFPESQEPDAIELNCADFSGIDHMREVIQRTRSYPMVGRYRVVILDEAHQLSKEAQNSLLAPFEAENSAIVWMICTTETQKIIPALINRCQIFQLKVLNKDAVHTLLQRAALYLEHEDYADFETEAIHQGIKQPRLLLNAFQNYHYGLSAKEAVRNAAEVHSRVLSEETA